MKYVESEGDPWAFFLIVDRIAFVVPAIVGLYLGFLSEGRVDRVLLCASLALLLIVTTPHRYGMSVALDYLVRRATGGI